MPIREYECRCGEIVERIFLSQKANPKTVRCDRCGRRALLAVSQIGFSKMTYGAAYGYATDSDRRDWLKKLDIRGWTGADALPIKTPKLGRRAKAKAKANVKL